MRLTTLLFLALAAGPLGAEASGPERAQLFTGAPEFTLTCRLTITDSTGDQKVRDLTIVSSRTAEGQKLLAQVTGPAFVKGLKFLRVESQGTTAVWIKTAKAVRRLPVGGDPEPVFGSDFTTADFQPGDGAWRATDTPGVYERPADRRSGGSLERMTLRTDDGLVLKSETLDARGSAVRRYEVVRFTGEGRPETVRITDLRQNRWSELTVVTLDEKSKGTPALFAPGSL